MTEYLRIGGGRIAYDVWGEGPLILCAPGMGDIRQCYRFLAPILVAAGYRVATMDLRGQGESSRSWPGYGQLATGRDMAALIRQLGGPAAVIGQSFTPDSALVAASELPSEVAATVLIAPWARPPRPSWLLGLAQSLVVRVPRLWCMFYSSLYPGSRPADFDRYLAGLRTSLGGRGGTRGLVAMADPSSRDATAFRSRATQPALILMGEEDPDFKAPEAEARAMAADLGGPAEVVMIPAAGHYPHAQAPDATGAAILSFLRRHLAAPAALAGGPDAGSGAGRNG